MTGSGFEGQIIGFYGAKHPSLFEIERRCMDRDGLVIQYLDRELPEGFVLDVGAGNGFTAIRLCSSSRTVVALEPDRGMVDAVAHRNSRIEIEYKVAVYSTKVRKRLTRA